MRDDSGSGRQAVGQAHRTKSGDISTERPVPLTMNGTRPGSRASLSLARSQCRTVAYSGVRRVSLRAPLGDR